MFHIRKPDKSGVPIRNNREKPEWMDFAGSYGIQTEFGKRIVKHVEGGIDNVMGLPLDLLRKLLEEAGCNIEGRK